MKSWESQSVKMLFPALICCGLVLLSAGPSFGQDARGEVAGADPVSDEPADQGFVLNIEVNLVNLFVSVLDRKGHVVSDLEKEDFYLWEGGERREISNFSTDPDAPLSMAVMLDVSGSMGLMQKLNNSRMAVELLVEHLNDPDEAALLAFAGTSVEQLVPLTSERDRLVQELETLKPFGKTALYRAIEEVPELLGSPLNRQAILLLTDGIDNCSQQPLEEMLNTLAGRRIPIYTICYTRQFYPDGPSSEEYTRIPVLQSIAGKSGGAYLEVSSPDELAAGLKGILTELRHQYLLGFSSTGDPGEVDRLDIMLLTSNSRHIVRVGRGFYADR
jgi:Ca-activated chloride channel family protein